MHTLQVLGIFFSRNDKEGGVSFLRKVGDYKPLRKEVLIEIPPLGQGKLINCNACNDDVNFPRERERERES